VREKAADALWASEAALKRALKQKEQA